METTYQPTDRQLLTILPMAECLQLIDEAPLGRIGFTLDGHQMILPVNHHRDGLRISFRSAAGAKVDAARNAAEVAFEVDGYDPDTRTGWSVVGVGTAALADPIMASHLLSSGLVPWADAVRRDHWIVITLRDVTGRRVGPSAQAHSHQQPEREAPDNHQGAPS